MENNTNTPNTVNKNSNTMWIVIGLIVLVLIAWFAFKKNNTMTEGEPVATTPDAMEVTEDVTDGSVNAGVTPTTGTAPVTLSYANALIKYKDARIQINDQCTVGKPNSLTFKNNTNIMIDNRSKVAHTVKVGTPVTVKGYGFKIVNVSSGTLPATWLVDCDARQNVATILIQK